MSQGHFIYFPMLWHVAIVISTSMEPNDNQNGGAIMVAVQTVCAMPSIVLAAVLFNAPAWADFGSRSDVPPIQSHQTVIVHEGQSPGAPSMPTFPGSFSADSLKTGNLNLRNVEGGTSGSRTITNSLAPFNNIRSDEQHEYNSSGTGIPLWRW
jgi:hypothetical protein